MKCHFLFSLIVLLFGIGTCGDAVESYVQTINDGNASASNEGDGAKTPKRLALLIGINRYKHESPELRPLHGCENDVELMRELLSTKFEFPDSGIRSLVNEEATRKEIVRAFEEHLIVKASPDSIVVFYFSGHGSQVSDTTGDEIDGKDETIVTYDSEISIGKNSDKSTDDLVDDQLNDLLKRLMAITKNVTYIFDSCHSGSMTKGLGEARMVDRHLPESSIPATTEQQSEEVPDYALITGCSSEQRSWEYTPPSGPNNGKTFGALTYFLTREIEAQVKEGVTYADIMDAVKLKVSAAKPQTPQLKGTKVDNFVFGVESAIAQPYLLVNTQDGNIAVRAGLAMGLTEGSLLDVYRPGAKKFDKPDEKIARIELTTVNDFTSQAKLVQGGPVPAASRAVIREISRASNPIRLYLDLRGKSHHEAIEDEATLGKVKRAITADDRLGKNTLFVEEEVKATTLVLSVYKDDSIAICYRGQPLSRSVKKTDEDAMQRVVAQITHWSKWINVLLIGNGNTSLNVEFEVVGQRSVDKEGFKLFHPKDQLTFSVRNNDHKPVYFAIVNLRSNGEITQIYPGRKGSEVQADELPEKKSWSQSTKVSLKPGELSTTDYLKLLVFDQTMDVSFLTLDAAPRDISTREFKAMFPLAEAVFQARDIEPVTSPDAWATGLETIKVVPQ